MVGLAADTLFQRQGYFMDIDTGRLFQLDPELETGPWPCFVYQESPTHSLTPITTMTGNIQWLKKCILVSQVDRTFTALMDQSLFSTTPWEQYGKGRNKTIFPAGSSQMLQAPPATVTLGLVQFFLVFFFPVCVSRILFVVFVFVLGLFICLFFVSFGLVLYFWFLCGFVYLIFFKCYITL